MIRKLWTQRVLIYGFVILFYSGQLSGYAHSENYDALVDLLKHPSPSVQLKGKEDLSRAIKKNILKRDPEQISKDIFLFGHLINPKTLDLAIGISFPRYWGNLIILTHKRGRYVPAEINTSVGFIESMEVIQLFPVTFDQLMLDLFGGGTGLRHWGKDVYRWDGERMRMIWAGVKKELYTRWPPDSHGEITGHVIQGKVFFNDINSDGIKEIITSTVIEEGIFEKQSENLKKIIIRHETKTVHRWDETLYFYVAKHGEILPPSITVRCWEGIPPKEGSETLLKGRKVGIQEIPGYVNIVEGYRAVIGKEHFCEIPKSAVKILNKN